MTIINPHNIFRGSLWLVDLNPVLGHEQAKKRPCLVVSANGYHQGASGLVIVLPLTSKPRNLFWYVEILSPDAGLSKKSYVLCDQIRTVSLMRFSPKCLGFVSDDVMSKVQERLEILLALISQR